MYKPYKEMVVNWLAFINEIFTIIAILTFYFFLKKHNTTETQKLQTGYFLTGVVMFMVAVNFFNNILSFVLDVYWKAKATRVGKKLTAKMQRKKKKIQPSDPPSGAPSSANNSMLKVTQSPLF